MRKTVYLHLRPIGHYNSNFVVAKMAKTRDSATRDGDVVLPVELELPHDFFDRAAIRVKVQPVTGEAR